MIGILVDSSVSEGQQQSPPEISKASTTPVGCALNDMVTVLIDETHSSYGSIASAATTPIPTPVSKTTTKKSKKAEHAKLSSRIYTEKLKTQLCRSVTNPGFRCSFGSRCAFAHSHSELRLNMQQQQQAEQHQQQQPSQSITPSPTGMFQKQFVAPLQQPQQVMYPTTTATNQQYIATTMAFTNQQPQPTSYVILVPQQEVVHQQQTQKMFLFPQHSSGATIINPYQQQPQYVVFQTQ
eukprot:PhF_6_TR5983/c0_g1_i2/m.8636